MVFNNRAFFKQSSIPEYKYNKLKINRVYNVLISD